MLGVDGRCKVEPPRVVGGRVLPVHEAFGRLADPGACNNNDRKRFFFFFFEMFGCSVLRIVVKPYLSTRPYKYPDSGQILETQKNLS